MSITTELTVTFFAEDFGLPKSVKQTNINENICWFEANNKKNDSLGRLLDDFCGNPFQKLQESGKIPGISREILFNEIRRATKDRNIIEKPLSFLELIYLEGLTLTFKIETSEITPKTPEVSETSGKEIKLKKLSTGYIKINDILIINNIELISFLYNFLNKDYKEIVSVTETITEIRFSCNKWIQLGSVPLKDIDNINIKKLIKQIMFDDVISEETFVI
jgi:seryl-tRNA(Sec) selenium transferase